jgi:dienelactone hydrolase
MSGLRVEPVTIGTTPATLYRPPGAPRGPVVVIAHGFAGSQALMTGFAVTFARNGLTAITYDLLGHGRNPAPLTGSITEIDGATMSLLREVQAVAAYARTVGDGRLAILGHSMAADIVVRAAEADPAIQATLAISMFSPAVTDSVPKNLLVVVGDWEPGLKAEALRVASLVSGATPARPGITYGDVASGTGRRVAFAPHVEHASVLYSQVTMRETQAWLDQVFGRPPSSYADARGPWIVLLIAGIILLIWPLAQVLPVVATPASGAGLGWRALWPIILVPMILVPLVLRVVPTAFLPTLVGDYLAVHFLAYGLVTGLLLAWRGGWSGVWPRAWGASLLASLGATVLVAGLLPLALDAYVTAFLPSAHRLVLIAVMLAGTLAYFLTVEWATHGPGKAKGGYAAAKLAFLVSLVIAVALDFERLFFLVLIVPVIVLFFLVTGLLSRWIYNRTGHPFVAAIACAVLFAVAIGVTFPLITG